MDVKTQPILFLINKLKTGGAEAVFISQINFLYKKGYDVYLGIAAETTIGLNRLAANAEIPADRIIQFKFPHVYSLKKYQELNLFVKDKRIGIIYSTLEDANIIARFIGLFNGKARVYLREANDASRKSLKNKLLDILFNFSVAKIIANSAGVKRSLLEYQPFYRNKIAVIANGVDMPDIDFNKAYNKKSREEIMLLNVGSLTRQKNQIEILKIFKDISREHDNARLAIVGEGGERKNLERYIRDNGLESKVELTGMLKKDELEKYYLKSHIFAFASLWEGCPNAVLEAMSYGLPVVSTKVFGAEEIIKDGKSGRLADIYDREGFKSRIKELISDGELRKKMGKAARLRIKENYTIEKNLQELIGLLNIK